jgi:hypothetical protein
LNAAGKAAISKTGVTKFSTRTFSDATNVEPPLVFGAFSFFNGYFATTPTNLLRDAKLVIEYEPGAPSTAPVNHCFGWPLSMYGMG